MVPAMYKKLFGEEGARVFGIGFSFIGVASLFQLLLFSTLGNYVSQADFFYIFGGMCVLAGIILIFLFEQKEVKIEDEDDNKNDD